MVARDSACSCRKGRDPREQSALRRAAKRLDRRRKRRTVTQTNPVAPYLEDLVVESYVKEKA